MTLRGPIVRRGAIAVWVAILGVVLVGFVGLAMDAGVVLLAGSHLQIAADAGALAGARLVREDILAARQAAYDIAYENKAMLFATNAPGPIRLDINANNMAPGDVVIGHYFRFADEFHDCCVEPCLCPGTDSPNAVRVRARRTKTSLDDQVPLVFGKAPLFNLRGIDVTRSATAIVSGGTAAGLIVLCPDCVCALDFSGGTDLVLESAPGYEGDASIQVNSDDECAVCGGGSFHLQAQDTNIVGKDPGYCFDGSPTIDTYLNPDSPAMPDPLAGLPAPTWGAPHDPPEIRGSGNFTPGYYPGGIRITASGDLVTLEPGIYVVDGEGLYVNGGSITAEGVLFYVIGTGKVNLGGNGNINIAPFADEGDTYWGISIFQARDNYNKATVIGNGNMRLDGTYYFPRAGYLDHNNRGVELGGDAFAGGVQLIAWTMWMHGNGTYTLNYDGRFPSPGSKVFLVE